MPASCWRGGAERALATTTWETTRALTRSTVSWRGAPLSDRERPSRRLLYNDSAGGSSTRASTISSLSVHVPPPSATRLRCTGRAEGAVSSKLSTWWTGVSTGPPPPSPPTGPSPPPGGGGGSLPRRQHRNEATTGLLRGYYESYYDSTRLLLRGYYAATTWLLRGYYETTTRPLPGYH